MVKVNVGLLYAFRFNLCQLYLMVPLPCFASVPIEELHTNIYHTHSSSSRIGLFIYLMCMFLLILQVWCMYMISGGKSYMSSLSHQLVSLWSHANLTL